ncbi:retrotransposon protein, putative, ty1-copia subclass [Tanacetum coccineum]|uniref:Retrotransposon protein, putative, ty1-copia subclass n=1 Tax=Tanacetum coccineum TaxID=301880 RepID=A0ABQ5CDC0_9ASTR
MLNTRAALPPALLGPELGKTVNELHAMLKLHEQTLNLPKNNAPASTCYSALVKSERDIGSGTGPQYLASLLKKKKNAGSGAVVLDTSARNASKMLQHDGTSQFKLDLRAFEKCIPCMSGKMAKENLTPSSGKGQIDLLGNYTQRYQEAVLNAMNVEMQSMKDNEVMDLSYIENYKDMFSSYGGDLNNGAQVFLYTDAGNLRMLDDLSLRLDMLFVLNGGAVDWKSAKEKLFFVLHLQKPEYIAALMLLRMPYGFGNSFWGSVIGFQKHLVYLLYWIHVGFGLASGRACLRVCVSTRRGGTSSLVSLRGDHILAGVYEVVSEPVTNVTSLINLRVAFHAINARRLPLAPLVYTLVRPSMTTSSANNSVFRGFFEKQKLTGPNFIDWYRQLRIVLSIEDKLNYLEQPLPPAPVAPEGQQVAPEIVAAHNAWIKGSKEIVGLMLMTMDSEIQQNLENLHVNDMLKELKTLFAQQADYIDNLERLGYPVTLGLASEMRVMRRKKKAASGAGWFQGPRASRKLKPGALSLYVGNGQCEAVEAIGIFYLCLPSGLEIILNNYHYAPSITRGVIFVSCLYEDGFINCFVNNKIQVSRNNMVYFSDIPMDGIFEIDLSNSYAKESSIYIVSNKRAKLDLDSALLWHCHLGHISKKRIKKLQHDGLLISTDLRAFEKFVPCMYGKMARKPYTHQVERSKDLLRLIHTDVCGPFKIMSRQGANYFVTFTDDFSRYGYVYLLKHKHEVSETFKVFQKEVENQLDKTIKLLRSDRVGEYISQEFLDHLKDHGIIAHRTPPYTPQHIDTSLNHEEDDLEIDEPQSDIIPIRRSTRTRRPIDRMCLYIDAEEHELGDLGEPANYKAALLDLESDKWLNAMNVEMQSMKDN